MTLFCADEAALTALGSRLGTALAHGDMIGLKGDVGAGKTVLARSMIRAALHDQALDVPSPTYTIAQQYDRFGTDPLTIWHADLYRLEEPEEAVEIGLLDAVEEAALLVEWPERLMELWPRTALTIHLASEGAGRRLSFEGGWPDRLSAALS